MPRPKYNPHPDANQPQLIDDLLKAGFVVIDCSRWAEVFDLLVYGHDAVRQVNRWQPVEVKTEEGELTEHQQAFMSAYPGAILVARCAEDVLGSYGRMG